VNNGIAHDEFVVGHHTFDLGINLTKCIEESIAAAQDTDKLSSECAILVYEQHKGEMLTTHVVLDNIVHFHNEPPLKDIVKGKNENNVWQMSLQTKKAFDCYNSRLCFVFYFEPSFITFRSIEIQK
jgi:hypothetical protein